MPQTSNEWVKRDEVDTGARAGTTTSEHKRVRALEWAVKELRRANDTLKTASSVFAQAEPGHRLKS